MPKSRGKKHTQIRGFEREVRLQALLDAGLVSSAAEVPNEALPASVTAARLTGRIFYLAASFRCRDCKAESVWSPEEQRFWFETIHGHTRSVATRCVICQKVLKDRNAPKRPG